MPSIRVASECFVQPRSKRMQPVLRIASFVKSGFAEGGGHAHDLEARCLESSTRSSRMHRRGHDCHGGPSASLSDGFHPHSFRTRSENRIDEDDLSGWPGQRQNAFLVRCIRNDLPVKACSLARDQQRTCETEPGESQTRQQSVESFVAHHPIRRESTPQHCDRIDVRGNSIPPDHWLGQGRDQRGVGRSQAKEGDDGRPDPEQRTKTARSEDGAYESGGSVKREVGRAKELLDAKDVRRNCDEGAEYCSGRGVARYPAPSHRFAKGNPLGLFCPLVRRLGRGDTLGGRLEGAL